MSASSSSRNMVLCRSWRLFWGQGREDPGEDYETAKNLEELRHLPEGKPSADHANGRIQKGVRNIASGLDFCIHMIRSDHGSAVVNQVARGTIIPPDREGAQYILRLVPAPETSTVSQARAWAMQHLDQPLSLDSLAKVAAVSRRTLIRKSREETGVSPMQWLIGVSR